MLRESHALRLAASADSFEADFVSQPHTHDKRRLRQVKAIPRWRRWLVAAVDVSRRVGKELSEVRGAV